MIKQLFEEKEKFYWSKTDEGAIVVGGSDYGRFYGHVILKMDEHRVVAEITISDGAASSMLLADRPYSNLTEEYRLVKELFDTIDDYLADPEIQLNQKLNRATLLGNVLELLPKHGNV